ncbi:hypothetical protein MCUN1_001155 [Malassezia cuniculi]|uniref:Uncharacterized protein n=1 Tax=Malassezia cuniculi TaxID=948313 RepID=A0AAF0ETX9_9BASI|nr:hypothetical protein MCUN1_001155 [Malassezia cuniculi]
MIGGFSSFSSQASHSACAAPEEDDDEIMRKLRAARLRLALDDENTCVDETDSIEPVMPRSREHTRSIPNDMNTETVIERRRNTMPGGGALPEALVIDLSSVPTPSYIDAERRRINGESPVPEEIPPAPSEYSGSKYGLGPLNAVESDECVWDWGEQSPNGIAASASITNADCAMSPVEQASLVESDWRWALLTSRTQEDDTPNFI